MPMQRDLYPPNWEAIALAKKEAANWTCEHCGRPCRRPGVDWIDFEMWLYEQFQPHFDWWDDCFEDGPDGLATRKPQRFTLTVAHLDQNPQNNAPGNLAALCAPCHLRHDAPHRIGNSYRKREHQGQLSLLHPIGGFDK